MADWAKVGDDAIAAAKGVLTGSWNAVAGGASAQITALVSAAQYVDDNRAKLSDDEVTFLMAQQKTALQNVLTAYEAIGIATAINTVSAVVNVVLAAAPGLVGLA